MVKPGQRPNYTKQPKLKASWLSLFWTLFVFYAKAGKMLWVVAPVLAPGSPNSIGSSSDSTVFGCEGRFASQKQVHATESSLGSLSHTD